LLRALRQDDAPSVRRAAAWALGQIHARDGVDELEATVEEVAQERDERMHFRLLGPMPAYHFIGTEAEEPAAA
jgi:hypothetical protein